MEFYTQPEQAATALFRYLMENPDNLPMELREKLVELLTPGKSISFAVSEAAEYIYANRKFLSENILSLGASLANVAASNRINNFADESGCRGWNILSSLRRESGESAPPGMEWPDPDKDPPPKQEYVLGSLSKSEDE